MVPTQPLSFSGSSTATLGTRRSSFEMVGSAEEAVEDDDIEKFLGIPSTGYFDSVLSFPDSGKEVQTNAKPRKRTETMSDE